MRMVYMFKVTQATHLLLFSINQTNIKDYSNCAYYRPGCTTRVQRGARCYCLHLDTGRDAKHITTLDLILNYIRTTVTSLKIRRCPWMIAHNKRMSTNIKTNQWVKIYINILQCRGGCVRAQVRPGAHSIKVTPYIRTCTHQETVKTQWKTQPI